MHFGLGPFPDLVVMASLDQRGIPEDPEEDSSSGSCGATFLERREVCGQGQRSSGFAKRRSPLSGAANHRSSLESDDLQFFHSFEGTNGHSSYQGNVEEMASDLEEIIRRDMCEQQPAKFSFLKDLRLLQADKSEADFNHSSGKALINKESLEDNEEIPRVRMNASDAMCDVCGAKAGKHTYYGGKVCPGKRVLIKTGVTLL